MSTILALWNRSGEPVAEELVRSMLAPSSHLESDGEDFWLQQDVALAHRHLWITPEEMGQPQPRLDPENGCVITCTARLDNRPELMRSLGLVEADAKTLSDADLILLAYRRWGVDCPKFLLGDFAFVLWDPTERRMFAARDALGGKELYYTLNQQVLLLASSISNLLEHPAVQPRLNETMIARYLAIYWEDDANTFYESIYHLPPAHCLVVTADAHRLQRYWDVDPGKEVRYARPEEYAAHYQELIKEALRCRMRSAYPVGISLSGGLDSSSLACLAVEVLSETGSAQAELGTYSYVFDELASCDERRYIQPVIEQASRTYPMRPRLVKGDALWPAPLKDDWLIHRDYPAQDPYYYLMRATLQAARQDGVRVMLSGVDGDDLYTGELYWFADLMLKLRFGQAVKILGNSGGQIDLKRELLDYGLRAMIPPQVKKWYRTMRPVAPAWEAWISPGLAGRSELRKIDTSAMAHLKFRLPGRQKRYSAMFLAGNPQRVTTMQAIAQEKGMEYRLPFTDRRIVEFVLGLPPEQIDLPGYSRRILRDALHGKLPEAIRQRQGKAWFNDLYDQGLYQHSAAEVQQLFRRSQLVECGFIRQDWLAHELAHPNFTRDGFIFWVALTLETWLRKYW